MASLALVTLLTLHILTFGVRTYAEETRSFIDDIRDLPNRFTLSLPTDPFNGTNPGFDGIRENVKLIVSGPPKFLQPANDETGNGQEYINVGGSKMLCFPGICKVAEVRSQPCENLDYCEEGRTLIDTLCGCCNECVDSDFDFNSAGILHT